MKQKEPLTFRLVDINLYFVYEFIFVCYYNIRKKDIRMVYVSSDTHFYHLNIHKYEPSRPENDEEVIVQRHNELVKKDDIWIFLGDLTCGLAYSGKSQEDVQ